MATGTIDRDKQSAKARAAHAKLARTRYYVQYENCEFWVRMGRQTKRFDWSTQETVRLGPFRNEDQAEEVIKDVLMYPTCVPGTAEIIEKEIK